MIERRSVPIPIARHHVHRIAVLRALQLGDLLLAVPALRSLRAGFPDAEISLIALPWARDFVPRFKNLVDRFVEFPGFPGLRERDVDPDMLESFFHDQRQYGYDLALQMHGSGRISNRFIMGLGASVSAGYFEGTDSHGLTIAAPYPDDQPEVIRNTNLVHMLGCLDVGTDLDFPLLDEDRSEASRLLRHLASGDGPWIGIHPGARPSARRWSPERFASLADILVDRYGARIVLTGGPDETDTVSAVQRAMTAPARNLAGRTSLGGLAAVIDRMDLFISNDTGPAHIAVAVNTPSVRIFGPADPVRWAPLEALHHPIVRVPVMCSPCPYTDCPIDHRCLQRVTVDMLLDRAEMLLAGRVVACNA